MRGRGAISTICPSQLNSARLRAVVEQWIRKASGAGAVNKTITTHSATTDRGERELEQLMARKARTAVAAAVGLRIEVDHQLAARYVAQTPGAHTHMV